MQTIYACFIGYIVQAIVNNFVPLAVPLIILILFFLLCYNFILFFVNVNRINKIVI